MADSLAATFTRVYTAVLGPFTSSNMRSRSQDRFRRKQWSRFWLGAAAGATLEIAIHWITSALTAGALHGKIRTAASPSIIALIASKYRGELLLLGICALAIGIPHIFPWGYRFGRSWWAGIVSLLPLCAALSTVVLFNWGLLFPLYTILGCAAILLLTLYVEFLRHKARPRPTSNAGLKIPRDRRSGTPGAGWNPRLGDEPISD